MSKAKSPTVENVEAVSSVLLNQQDSIRKSSAVAYLTFFLSILASVLLAIMVAVMYSDHLLLRDTLLRSEHDRAAEREACQQRADAEVRERVLLREAVERNTEELRTVRRVLERMGGSLDPAPDDEHGQNMGPLRVECDSPGTKPDQLCGDGVGCDSQADDLAQFVGIAKAEDDNGRFGHEEVIREFVWGRATANAQRANPDP